MLHFNVDICNILSYNNTMYIEVSHESPISMLEHSLTYNDYAYALVHLFETHPRYYNFFKNLTQSSDVPVLLDNSIFELKKAFDPKKYCEWISKLKPNYYIVPDVLEDYTGTRDAWNDWMLRYTDNSHTLGEGALKIGVVQGVNWNDLVECYKFMAEHAEYVAISFDYSYYQHTGYSANSSYPHRLAKMKSGRIRFIQQLIDEGIWCWEKPHHLLGCSLASEFRWYVDNSVRNIKSCDTSNPVVASIKGLRYNDDMGLNIKPSTLLADLIDHEMTDDQIDDLEYNTKMFKKIIRR
jgi:hypothetical protein